MEESGKGKYTSYCMCKGIGRREGEEGEEVDKYSVHVIDSKVCIGPKISIMLNIKVKGYPKE